MQVEKEIVKAIQHMEEVEVEVKRKKEISSKVKQLRKQVSFVQYTACDSVVWHVCTLLAAMQHDRVLRFVHTHTHTLRRCCIPKLLKCPHWREELAVFASCCSFHHVVLEQTTTSSSDCLPCVYLDQLVSVYSTACMLHVSWHQAEVHGQE